jgi:hypothetical protein
MERAWRPPHLPLDGVEIVNNSGFTCRLYDAWAAFRNAEWLLAVTGGSDAHDVAYVGSAVTRFEGRDAAALRRALLERRTRAHLEWKWTIGNVPRPFAVKVQSFVRSLNAGRRVVPAGGQR